MDTTPLAPVCPNCGKPLAATAPAGLCPECLTKSGFETNAVREPADDKPAFVPPPTTESPIAGMPPENYVLDIGSCLNRGWALVRGDFWRIVGVTTLSLLLQWASFIVIIKPVVSGPLLGGLLLYFLKKIRGERSTLGTTFSGFSNAYLSLFLGGLVTILLTFVGACCLVLPGIYLAVAWSLTLALIIDKQLGFWEAMELSRKRITQHWWKFFGFIIILWLIKMAGTMVFFVGYLVAAPVALATLMYAYEDIFGAKQLAAVPPPVAPAVAASSLHPIRAWAWVIAVLLALLVIAFGAVSLLRRHVFHVATGTLLRTPAPTAAQHFEPKEQNAKVNSTAINDDFWLHLDRRNYQHYREALGKAPRVLVVRLTHYNINKQSATGIGTHYGWIDGKLANLCVGFSDLVSYGYSPQATWDEALLTRTEFPPRAGSGEVYEPV